ncbi:MAG: hypothetical protein ACRDJ9_12570 [Dehalococcoidia bacterium]
MATFYREVRRNPPTERDFLSYKSLGRRLPVDTPEMRRSWEGVSVRSTLAAARDLAHGAPRIGAFIAVMEIEDDGPVRVEKTGANPTHYDLHGEAGDLLAAVVAVFPA